MPIKKVWVGEYDDAEFGENHTAEPDPKDPNYVIVNYTGEVHAHVETQSSDCDGVYTKTYLMSLQPNEKGQEHEEILFHDRVVAHLVNSYSLMATGSLSVTKSEGDDRVVLAWTEPTEEGYRAAWATICYDLCDLEEPSTQRDHTAEKAGY